jgi:hypothetical protein
MLSLQPEGTWKHFSGRRMFHMCQVRHNVQCLEAFLQSQFLSLTWHLRCGIYLQNCSCDPLDLETPDFKLNNKFSKISQNESTIHQLKGSFNSHHHIHIVPIATYFKAFSYTPINVPVCVSGSSAKSPFPYAELLIIPLHT